MMYKLEKGKLVSAPAVWKGIVGYNNDLERLVKDGWKPLIVVGEGSVVEYKECDDHIEERHSEPPYDYKELRRQAYPSLGDMIDAICKAYDGEPDELNALMAQRNIVKATIKKVPDAD
ncbi:MAG: hypothetical protein IIZ94_06690 [Prevotella sp.]|jgi:hypothetical protein|nr:hypothetical protein [Prevotella sp.]